MKKLFTLLFVLSFACLFAQTYKANQKVLIKWNDDWFPGKIIEVRTDGYFISYDNYDSSWNEAVGTDRLKNIDGETSNQPTTTKAPTNTAPTESTNATSNNPVATKASEYCACMETANQTKKLADKEKCLDLKDAHLASFEAGSQPYMDYKQKITECKNNGAGNITNDPKSFNDNIKAVCDCFEESKKDKSKRMGCFKLQSQYNSTYTGDDSVKFLNATNKCAD